MCYTLPCLNHATSCPRWLILHFGGGIISFETAECSDIRAKLSKARLDSAKNHRDDEDWSSEVSPVSTELLDRGFADMSGYVKTWKNSGEILSNITMLILLHKNDWFVSPYYLSTDEKRKKKPLMPVDQQSMEHPSSPPLSLPFALETPGPSRRVVRSF